MSDSDQYIHTTVTGSTKAIWDVLEEKGDEDELGNRIVLCGDLNARSCLWGQQGNNPKGNALEEALGDIAFGPVAIMLQTRLGPRQDDLNSTIVLAVVSPHGADHQIKQKWHHENN